MVRSQRKSLVVRRINEIGMYVPRARPVNRDLSVSMTRCWHSSYCLADVESFDVVIDLGICAHEQSCHGITHAKNGCSAKIPATL